MNRSRMQQLKVFGMRSVVTTLIVCLMYADLSHVPLLGPLLREFAPEPVAAASGDFSVYRNSSDTTALTTTPTTISWDTQVVESGTITRQPGNTNIDLSEGGKYLVLYNVWSNTGPATGGNRREIDTYLSLNGTPQPWGYSTGYVRDFESDINAYNAGAAILSASPGDDLTVEAVRTDVNTAASMAVRAGTNGLSVVKLNDNYDYLRLQQTGGTANVESYVGFTDVVFNQADEVDTGSFGYTASSTASEITLKGTVGQKFLVTANVKIDVTVTTNTRQNYEMRLVRDGIEIPGTRTNAYPRGNQNNEEIYGGTMTYVGIIEKLTSGDEVVRLQLRREGPGSAATSIVGGETAVAMVALPTGIPSIGLTYGGAGQTLATTQTPFNWDTQTFIDSGTFTHSTTTNNSRVEIATGGDYLFFSTVYTDRTSGTGRDVPRIDWRLDGTSVVQYGGHGSFNRGDQGTNDAFTSGSSGGLLLDGLTAGQYLELLHSDETTGTPNAVFSANRIALQGISVAALTSNDVSVAPVLNQTETVAPSTSGFNTGLQFSVVEETGARNITSITLSEVGTIDAQNDLSNVALYYDLDTSDPYNCASESFNGNETQYGATSTGGFTGANGVSSYVDSVSISTSQTFCGYVVLDVGSGAFNGETINLTINDPSSDVAVSGGGVVIPNTTILDSSVTTVVDAEVTQSGYHWRNDDGSETGATSATGGLENTPLLNAATSTPQRLRLGVYNAGTGSTSQQFVLEYAPKVSTCEAATGWSTVGASGADWDLFDSSNLTNGNDTTNIPIGDGGVSDPVVTFVTNNDGVRDTTATSGLLTLGTLLENVDGEFDTISVLNGSSTTITLDNTYDNPVVAVSVRYSRSTETQRTPRVVAKTNSSFDVLIDNYDSSLTGTTQIDYLVVEAGTHNIPSGAGTLQVYAGTTSVPAAQTYGSGAIPSAPTSTAVVYPIPFGTQPLVFATVASNNDPDWVFASAYDGIAVENPPTATVAEVFMNENFESDGHGAAETIDIIALEPGTGTNDNVDFVWQQTGSTITSTPSTVSFTAAYTSTPSVILAYHPTNGGVNGGFTLVDTDTAPTNTGVTVAVDEDGTGADRGHTGTETASIVSFATPNRLLASSNLVPSFAELEYALQATNNAIEGIGYCFRVSDAGMPLRNYSVYPEATLNADVTVSATGTQTATIDAGETNEYLGGALVIQDNIDIRTLTDITVTETGSIDAATEITAVRLRYELDTSAPYDCESETYDGTETFFGSSQTFALDNGTTTFTDTVGIATTSAWCGYLEVSVAASAVNGQTLGIAIANPANDVQVSAGSVGPGSTVTVAGDTTINAAALNQTGYHWRNDDGDEAGASSATGGTENTAINDIPPGDTQRLRLAVSNDGAATSTAQPLRLEYGVKVTTCANVSGWQRIDDGAAFTMATTSQLTEGADTSTVAPGTGGISDPNTEFLTPNGGQRESDDETGLLSLNTSQFVEVEFAIQATNQSAFDTTYCFRTTTSGTPLSTYDAYAELTTRPQQDFFVQRGTERITGTSTTLIAGSDYTAPANATAAFIRITNSHHTGAGGVAGAQDTPDDFTAYIENPGNIMSSITIARPATANDDTEVSWEIVEYIGLTGADNEMIVRDVGTLTYGSNSLSATGTSVGTISDDSDVAVFITGQQNPDTGTANYNVGLSISSWNASASVPVFERGDADGIAAPLSYAVVEFTGANWQVQRVEHTYTAAGVVESEAITPVPAVTQTFLHTQKLTGNELFNLDDTGHEVYLSGMGTVSFELQAGDTIPSQHRSVAWVIGNAQTGSGALRNYRSNGTISTGGGDNAVFSLDIGSPVQPNNASIFINNQSTGGGNFQPRGFLGATIASSTNYELYRSDDGQNQDYRVSVIEWPVAELSIRQNYYRLYVDNDTLQPTDPWPVGAADLGENESMTDLDEPLGLGERVRIRMSLLVNNASLVSGSKQFTLEYGRRVTSCSAVSTWNEVGAPGSGDIWRGYNGTPVDGTPVASSTLLLSVSDQPGTYEEANDSALNPTTVDIGEDIEYDWVIENNGALQKNSYCFRVVEAGGALLDGYDFYPTVRTSGYTPVITNWRWYEDVANVTPTTPAAAEQVAATNVDVGDTLKLRVAVTEIEGASGENIKFNLEYSEYSDFRDGGTLLTATSSCTGGQFWCYADGGGVDNDYIPSTVLSGVDSCVAGVGDGCGVYNEIPGLTSPFDHVAGVTAEHEFTLQHDAALVNRVYYFRLVDVTNGVPLVASGTLPSVMTAGSDFTLTINGLPSGTTTEGVVTDAASTPERLYFPDIPLNTEQDIAHRLSVTTNATGGYRVFLRATQPLQSAVGETIPDIAATNAVPGSWSALCPNGDSCFGYHTGDDSLSGDPGRFALDDTYAALPVGVADEVMYNTLPHSDTQDIVYRIQINLLQPAGAYTTNIEYVAVPSF